MIQEQYNMMWAAAIDQFGGSETIALHTLPVLEVEPDEVLIQVEPQPQVRSGVQISSYNGIPSPEAIDRLNRLIESVPFEVHVARTFLLEAVAEAHRTLDSHYLGKLALRTQ